MSAFIAAVDSYLDQGVDLYTNIQEVTKLCSPIRIKYENIIVHEFQMDANMNHLPVFLSAVDFACEIIDDHVKNNPPFKSNAEFAESFLALRDPVSPYNWMVKTKFAILIIFVNCETLHINNIAHHRVYISVDAHYTDYRRLDKAFYPQLNNGLVYEDDEYITQSVQYFKDSANQFYNNLQKSIQHDSVNV